VPQVRQGPGKPQNPVIPPGCLTFFILGPNEGANLKRQFFAVQRLGLVEKIQEDEKELAAEAEQGKLDLANLWAANQRRIDYYHDVAMDQAKSSYKTGRRAMIAGFVTVIALGVVAAFALSATASVAASVIGVAGAAMGSHIGATFMKALAEASAQLSQFFLQPVEFSRLLDAERLLDTLEPEQRGAAAQQVIQAMMIPPARTNGTKKDTKARPRASQRSAP